MKVLLHLGKIPLNLREVQTVPTVLNMSRNSDRSFTKGINENFRLISGAGKTTSNAFN